MNRFVAKIFSALVSLVHIIFFGAAIIAIVQIWMATHETLNLLRYSMAPAISFYSDTQIKGYMTLAVLAGVALYALIFGVTSMFIHMSDTLEDISARLERLER